MIILEHTTFMAEFFPKKPKTARNNIFADAPTFKTEKRMYKWHVSRTTLSLLPKNTPSQTGTYRWIT